MKNHSLSILTAGALSLLMISAGCNNTKTPFVLTGTIEGITDGEIIMSNPQNSEFLPDTAIIKNGKFEFRGDIPEPDMYFLEIPEKEAFLSFYAENSKMTMSGSIDSLYNATITGSKINDDEKLYRAEIRLISEKHNMRALYNEILAADSNFANISDHHRRLLDSLNVIRQRESDSISELFVRQHPSAYYSLILIERLSYGKSADEIEALLKLLDPSLSEYTRMEDLYRLVENLKVTDVGVSGFIPDAPDVAYATDPSFAGKSHTDIIYLAAFPDDNICCLKKDGNLIIIDPKGKKTGGFASQLTSEPGAVAIDRADNHIYVLGTLTKTTSKEIRGRKYEIKQSVGVECLVYDINGVLVRKLELKELKSATGAKVADGKLIVADVDNRSVFIFNAGTGAMESSVTELRACCGILDFGITTKNEILIANLGAFRVQGVDYSGNIKYAFGKRGPDINDFHGCCNPVNVAYLSNGAIVTVEKDPTEIKVFSKGGAKKIAGIEELVRGCAYIPMISDSKNNLYLASARNGLVKCIAN